MSTTAIPTQSTTGRPIANHNVNQEAHMTAPSTVTVTDLARLMHDRAATYGLLARLYRVEVDEALLNEMRTMKYPAKTGTPQIDTGYRLIRNYLSGARENTLDDLAVDYVRCFIGHGNTGFSAAYPFESVYTSARRLLMQDARDEVLALYRAAGKDKAANWKEAEDHIALELEFMAHLCKMAGVALESGDEETAYALVLQQSNFLYDHLENWVPLMMADMERFAKTAFYRGTSRLTLGVIEADRAVIDELLAEQE